MPQEPTPLSATASALMVLCVLGAAGAQQFARQPVAQGDFGVGAPLPIDLDGDGDLDFVAAIANTRRLQHWRNVGGSRCVPFAAPLSPSFSPLLDRRHAALDFDRDGDEDLLVGASAGGSLRILRNDQGLLGGSMIPLPNVLVAVVLGVRPFDADRDGDPDLLVRGTAGVALLRNDGNGGFAQAPAGTLPAIAGNMMAETGDFDGDGAIDVVIAAAAPPRLWMNRGSGFVDESATRLPTLVTATRQATVADLDGDGDLDIVGMDTLGPAGMFLLRNDGSGVFVDDSVALAGVPAAGSVLLATDLDADGDDDLVVDRTVLANDGAGRFQAGVPLTVSPTAVVDLDGDRWPDLLTSNGLARNDGGRGFTVLSRCFGVAAGDLDTDGDLDVLGTTGARWTVEGGSLRVTTGGPTTALSAILADVDGDGDVDLVDRASGSVRIHANDGSGNLTLVLAQSAATLLPAAVAVFDLERDGDLDLAWGNGTVAPTTPIVLRNDGNMTFTDVTATVLPPGSQFSAALITADVDADRNDDLLAVDILGTRWFRNRGDGTFENGSARLAAGFGGQTVRAIQIDRDPELELLAVRNPDLVLLDRVGNDWVDATWRLPAAGPATDAVPLDFDDDGALDLAIAGGGGFLLRNDGNGVFVDVTLARGPFSATALAAFDVDGDGDPDLLDGLDLWINQQRHLELAAPVAAGGQLVLEFVAEPGLSSGVSVCVASLGLQRSIGGLAVLGGTLLPEPATSVMLGALVSVAGTRGRLAVPVPSVPLLRAVRLQMQGLVIGARGELGLANHLVATID